MHSFRAFTLSIRYILSPHEETGISKDNSSAGDYNCDNSNANNCVGGDNAEMKMSSLCSGLILCLPHFGAKPEQIHESDMSPSFDFSFIRAINDSVAAAVSDSNSLRASGEIKYALYLLQMWILFLGGDSYFLLPKAEEDTHSARHNFPDSNGITDVAALQPLKGGYTAFRFDPSLVQSVRAYWLWASALMTEITDLMLCLSDIICDDDAIIGSIHEASLNMIDDLQMRLAEYERCSSSNVTSQLFGFVSPARLIGISRSIVYRDFNIGDESEFARLLTQLCGCTFAYVTGHEIITAAFQPSLSKSAQAIAHPNVNVITNLHSLIGEWVISTIASASSSSTASVAATFTRFIIISRHLRFLGNFQGLVAVVSGLQRALLSDLGSAFEDVGKEQKDCYSKLYSLCSPAERYKVRGCTLFLFMGGRGALPSAS